MVNRSSGPSATGKFNLTLVIVTLQHFKPQLSPSNRSVSVTLGHCANISQPVTLRHPNRDKLGIGYPALPGRKTYLGVKSFDQRKAVFSSAAVIARKVAT